MHRIDSSNTLFTLASDMVNHTCRDVFLTGKAGSGKTTFLKFIKENCPKQMAVVAPTGVAAINAGGVTIHSFFQLPLGPFIPQAKGFAGKNDAVSDRHSLLARLRFNSDRRKVLQELELLIIDEVSMVRCDVLDAIDVVLRYVRHRPLERFGGVQVLLVGDLFQLPPVVKDQEWQLLGEYYSSPYFFDCWVLRDSQPVCVEFTKIYRQTEEHFIRLLNKVRSGELDNDDLALLHERFRPGFFGEGSDGYILLTSHNEKAREINVRELEKLPGKTFTYKAGIDGEFPSSAFPADELLQLKIGAQVMFIRNDMEKARRFFNGKIGVVTKFDEDKIFVQCNDGSPEIEVTKESWKNIRYSVDKNTRQVSEDVLGSFNQYPLRLAWAITIHKSQGLTFERAVIDAGRAFAPGQVYVALSRCTSLEGLILHSEIHPRSLYADERISRFTQNMMSADALRQELVSAKKAYELKSISSLFDFVPQKALLTGLKQFVVEHSSSFNEGVIAWLQSLIERVGGIHSTGEKFKLQLTDLFSSVEQVEGNGILAQRMKAASDWFTAETQDLLKVVVQSPARTDSSLHAKSYNANIKEVFAQLSCQQFMLSGISEHWGIETFHQRKKAFVVPPCNVNAYAGAANDDAGMEHLDLYRQLKTLRDDICERKNLPIYLVAGTRSLEELAIYLPRTMDELQKISGFGKARAERYGPGFLSIINEYCSRNGLDSKIAEKQEKRKRRETRSVRPDTKAETLRLFREGKDVRHIAQERNLASSTIEGHLAFYVRSGEVRVEELIPPETLSLLQPFITGFSGGSIMPIKEKLGSRVSFGEIRWAVAASEFRKSSAHIDH